MHYIFRHYAASIEPHPSVLIKGFSSFTSTVYFPIHLQTKKI
jgi:hypothetical protein